MVGVFSEYIMNVHDYSRPVTHHQVRTPKKPATAKMKVFNTGGVDVVDYQFLIPKRFESGDYKVCIGYNVQNPPKKAGYIQDGYIIPWKPPEIKENPKFQYLKKKKEMPRLVKTAAIVVDQPVPPEPSEQSSYGHDIELQPQHLELPKTPNLPKTSNLLKTPKPRESQIISHHVEFDLSEEQFRSEDTFLPLIKHASSAPAPKKRVQRRASTPIFEDIIIDKSLARRKAKEMAEKQKQLISNALKFYGDLKNQGLSFKDMDLMGSLNGNLQEALMKNLERCSPKSRTFIFKSILEGHELEDIMNIAPEMARPIDEYDEMMARDSVIMYKLPTPNHAEEVFIPETYRKLSSTIKIQHKTLVPTRKQMKREEGFEEEQGNMSKFFRDFQALLDRQHKLEREAVAMIGNFQTDLETRTIARYPLDDLLKLIWNQFNHLKDSYEDIVPAATVQAFYGRMRNILLITDGFPNDDVQHAEFIKEQIKSLDRRCYIYLKAFTGHMKRTVGVCSESILGGPHRLCLGLSKLFGNLIFRTAMPKTDDVYVLPSLAIRKIDFSDENIGLSAENELDKTLKKDNFWDEDDIKEGPTPLLVENPLPITSDSTAAPEIVTKPEIISKPHQTVPNLEHLKEPKSEQTDDPLLREILQQHGVNLGNLSQSEKALFNPEEKREQEPAPTPASALEPLYAIEQKSEEDLLHLNTKLANPNTKSIDLIEKHKVELELFEWDKMGKEELSLQVFQEEYCLNAYERALHIILLFWDSIFSLDREDDGRHSGKVLERPVLHKMKTSKENEKLAEKSNGHSVPASSVQFEQVLVNGKEMIVENSNENHAHRPRSTHNPRPKSTRTAHSHSDHVHLPQLIDSFRVNSPRSTRAHQKSGHVTLEQINQPFLVVGDTLPVIDGTRSPTLRPGSVRSVSRRIALEMKDEAVNY
ncbi:hypothetical protein HDV01_007664 [Terramyces sp. JEL0728]|nr:hypothetical protein HDV01_007664 [Terramyces sp. JEL0728]